MPRLTSENLRNIYAPNIIIPDKSLLQLPEKIFQFGTGVLLRGLPDYFVDEANRKGIFNGRIVAIKSTNKGPIAEFNKQNCLYTIAIRGVENKAIVNQTIICSSLSRVLPASTNWADAMKCSANPDLKIIISNTTEAGLQPTEETIFQKVPKTFPGKLLAFLHYRYYTLKETKGHGMVIIPTELVPANGQKLKEIMMHLAACNKLGYNFISWLEHENHFCNSLVDRIVPGRPDGPFIKTFESDSGYTDELLIITEPYCLWAIEGNDEITSILSFAKADTRMIITPDIQCYREIKLRILNASHTLSCGINFIAGIKTVKEAMDNHLTSTYISELMFNEIIPAIPYQIEKNETVDFAQKTLDRFRNPYIYHEWLNISHQYSMKMRVRVVPVLFRYYELFHVQPCKIAFGFAAYIFFMRIRIKKGTQYFGENEGVKYLVTDDEAAYFYELWHLHTADTDAIVEKVLKNTSLWPMDLTLLPGFSDTVKEELQKIFQLGMLKALNS